MRSSATGRALASTGAVARRVLLRERGLDRGRVGNPGSRIRMQLRGGGKIFTVNCPVPILAPNTITR
jgi:hypothetical protein